MLFGDRPADHQMLAEHLCNERPEPVEGRGRKLNLWIKLPGDNHYLDCIVGCAVAASMVGVGQVGPAKTRERVSFADQQQRAAR